MSGAYTGHPACHQGPDLPGEMTDLTPCPLCGRLVPAGLLCSDITGDGELSHVPTCPSCYERLAHEAQDREWRPAL